MTKALIFTLIFLTCIVASLSAQETKISKNKLEFLFRYSNLFLKGNEVFTYTNHLSFQLNYERQIARDGIALSLSIENINYVDPAIVRGVVDRLDLIYTNQLILHSGLYFDIDVVKNISVHTGLGGVYRLGFERQYLGENNLGEEILIDQRLRDFGGRINGNININLSRDLYVLTRIGYTYYFKRFHDGSVSKFVGDLGSTKKLMTFGCGLGLRF